MLTPFASFMQSLTPTNIPAQIANVHTVFNVVTTLLLLPFGAQLVKLSYLVLPEKKVLKINYLLSSWIIVSLPMIITLELVQSLTHNYLMKHKIC